MNRLTVISLIIDDFIENHENSQKSRLNIPIENHQKTPKNHQNQKFHIIHRILDVRKTLIKNMSDVVIVYQNHQNHQNHQND